MEAGISVIPTLISKGKRPCLPEWTTYKTRRASEKEVDGWGGDSIACICGEVSDNLFCLDLDTKYDTTGKLLADFREVLEIQTPGLLGRLVSEQTVSGGYHLIFKTPGSLRNQKLACRKDGLPLIETRGEGGYFICAPSPGYTLKKGDIAQAPKLNQEEVDSIFAASMVFNEKENDHFDRTPKRDFEAGKTPLDDYDEKTTVEEILSLLEGVGWKPLRKMGEKILLCRPEKKERAVSATLNYIPGKFYVFTTSTQFESGRSYSAAGVYAVINHQGNFSEAAKDLYSKGFGDRAKKTNDTHQKEKTITDEKKLPKTSQEIKLIEGDQIGFSLYDLLRNGIEKGVDSGFRRLDKTFSFVKGHLNIVTGIPSHGKSEMVDALFVNLARKHDWRFLIFSPENYPVQLHMRKIAEKYLHKNMFSKEHGKMSEEELDEAIDFISNHFSFIDVGESEANLDHILQVAAGKKIDAVLIDPWNEINSDRPKQFTEHEHIGSSLSKCRKFARKNNISFWIVAHPIKIRKDQKTGETPVPTMYDINGSSNWFNKADNGFCVYRNFDEESVSLHIQKVKFRYYGKPGEIKFKYLHEGGVFREWEDYDDFQTGPNKILDYKSLAGGDL